MSAPEKCPKCGAAIDKTNVHQYHATTSYLCNSMFNTSIGLTQSKDCKKAELPFVTAERDALLAANAELEARLAGMVPRETMERACRLSYNVAANRYHGAPKDGVSDNDQPTTDALIELSAKATRLLDGEERDIAACLARAEAEAANAAQGGDHAG